VVSVFTSPYFTLPGKCHWGERRSKTQQAKNEHRQTGLCVEANPENKDINENTWKTLKQFHKNIINYGEPGTCNPSYLGG
jgi:hypothetical protein